MKEIELTQGLKSQVDDKDYEWLNQWKWCADKSRRTFYAVRTSYIGKQHKIRMHRLIMDNAGNRQIDHIDNQGLNNQRSNLRFCTNQQNQMNQKVRDSFKGVYWRKDRGNWQAHICKNRKLMHLGTFISETEAALAYNLAATELFGEFARLNIIEEKHG